MTPRALEGVAIVEVGEGLEVRWEPASEARWVAIQVRESAGAPWRLVVVPAAKGAWAAAQGRRPAALALRAVGKTGAAGPVTVWALRE